VRRIFPAANALAAYGAWLKSQGKAVSALTVSVNDTTGPVAGAHVDLKCGDSKWPAETGADGRVAAYVLPGTWSARVKAVGSVAAEGAATVGAGAAEIAVNLETPARVMAAITGDAGAAIPCKVQFKGLNGTASPDWGPKSARHAIENLYYSENGKFTVPINPGEYEAIVSYGPVYDVERVKLTVVKGQTAPLTVRLKRSVMPDGWVSADYHSHSSPSGDNTTDQRGRVLNLLCEHIDFAPCTEHARVDSYVPHLEALGVKDLMGTCSGMELTGSPLPLAHLNAFPLKLKPRTQNNGGPDTASRPEDQLKRLSEWDDNAEKLVQQNHPDIGWLFFDRNGDYTRDEGHKEGFKYMNVIEVHPIDMILEMKPAYTVMTMLRNNRIFNWLQLLNLGFRIPGVVNTDAHYNSHGSGGVFNWVLCSEKVPGKIDPLEIVRNSKAGHIVMSNGPFLRVDLNGALPGADLSLPGGEGLLNVEVQSANWVSIDRVQVLINGRPETALNFTRADNPDLFQEKSGLRFKKTIPISLKSDAHVIVVATGNTPLGDVMGPDWGKQKPAALSNPIYVDVDGGGFKANGDTLGGDIPVKGDRPVK
jgi:hypothetical protein